MKHSVQLTSEGAKLVVQVLEAVDTRDVVELARRVDQVGLNHARKRISLDNAKRELQRVAQY